MAYEASSAASALEAWSAVTLASRLASCAATKASVARPSSAFAIFVSTSSGVSNPSTVESRAASALASALPRRAASRAAVVTAPRRAVEIFESTSEEVSTAGVRLGGLQPRDGGVSARELGGQRRGGDGPQESVGHLGVYLQRRDPRRYVQGALVHHRLETVVGGHRGQRGVVGRGDGTVHGRRGAVVGQLQVHAVRGALRRHHALQHVEGRQRALQRGDAASVRGHLPVRGGQGRRRGKRRNRRRQRAAVQLGGQLCGDPVVQGLDGRRVVAGGCRVHRQVRYLSVRRESQGQLSCCDVRAVSHLSVVQDLRDVAGDRSFKHVFLGVGVIIRIHNDTRRRLLMCQTHQPLFGTSFRTCHSPWVTLRARPAPRLRSWSPHQARTRPARWRGICNGACVCFFRTLRRLFSSFSNSENLQSLRRTPAQHPTCEFQGAHRLSSFSKVHQDLYLSL